MQNFINFDLVEQTLADYESLIDIGEYDRTDEFNTHYEIGVDESATAEQFEQIAQLCKQLADQYDVFVSVCQIDQQFAKFGRELV